MFASKEHESVSFCKFECFKYDCNAKLRYEKIKAIEWKSVKNKLMMSL